MKLRELLRAHPLISFFVLAYAVTWALWAPLVANGIPAFSATRHVPSLAALPAVAIGVTGTAFFMTAVTHGRAGVRRLLQRLTCWDVGLVWYLVALLLIPLIELLFTAAMTGPEVFRALTPSALALYPAAFAAHFIFGPLFEETGWRGFALPRMQQRFGPLRGSLLLGLLWAGWHFFLYAPSWFAGGAVAGLAGIAVFIGFTTTVSVVFTWLSNNTRASLLLVMLLHGSINGTATYVQVLADRGVISAESAQLNVGLGALFASTLVAALIVWLTHRRLSYPRYQYEAEHFDVRPSETMS
ncbi:MAG: type II CAAX prenyl endopeptidase Rce1 family protein [Mycobacterium sp.]